ncbi:hypothetical protein M413DRAFT_16655 [Hebeloma cylindrosporum]|uniref:DUF2423 domain-containing protein n=1 Tax=Hebeloma cylindrosporum TaxID=76867 RepID=A0A0C2Y7I9_HEBCY|nr:hypothetical protein M413DRAFT_16655 [Hebeloma cylindrosporum h7]
MAKSLRSKTKRAFRSKKRESGVYAAAAAGRLQRLNSKLIQTIQKDSEGDVLLEEGDNVPDSMAIDAEPSTKVSTHGPRGSRREEWRKSKGLPARASSHGMNRQGMVAGKRKAGRSQRRR